MDLLNLSIYQRLMLSRQLRVSQPTQLLKFSFFYNGKERIIFNRGKDTDIACRRLCLALSSWSQILVCVGNLFDLLSEYTFPSFIVFQMSGNAFFVFFFFALF